MLVLGESDIDSVQSGPIADGLKIITEFTKEYDRLDKEIPEIEQITKDRLFCAVIYRLSGLNEPICHQIAAPYLCALRILAREKTTVEINMKNHDIRAEALMKISGVKPDPNFELYNSTEKAEALKAIFNMLLISPDARKLFLKNRVIEYFIKLIEHFTFNNEPVYTHDVKYFTLRNTFIMTALCEDGKRLLQNELEGFRILHGFVMAFTQSKEPFDDGTVDLICEAMKIMYNILNDIFPYREDMSEHEKDIGFKKLNILTHLSRTFLLRKAIHREKQFELHSHSIDLLAIVTNHCLLTLINAKEVESSDEDEEEYEYEEAEENIGHVEEINNANLGNLENLANGHVYENGVHENGVYENGIHDNNEVQHLVNGDIVQNGAIDEDDQGEINAQNNVEILLNGFNNGDVLVNGHGDEEEMNDGHVINANLLDIPLLENGESENEEYEDAVEEEDQVLEQEEVDDEDKEFYMGFDMSAIRVMLIFFEERLNTDPSEKKMTIVESLSPILCAFVRLVSMIPEVRKYLRSKILPPLQKSDVVELPAVGSTMRNKLCALMTSPAGSIAELACTFLFVLTKENVRRLIKYTGFGNAAGLLANRGLLNGQKNAAVYEYSSDSGDSDTEEYKEVSEMINDMNGVIQEPHTPPCEGMSEEQKEYEAMRLVNAIDQFNRHSIIQPATVGPDGRIHPMEHVSQLLESSNIGGSGNDGNISEESD